MIMKFLLHKDKEENRQGLNKSNLQADDRITQRAILPYRLLLIANVFVLILSSACSMTKSTTKIEKISFGNGGGFTGNVTEYTILPNGEIVKHESLTNEKTIIKKIDKKETIKVYNQISNLNYRTYTFNHPGNTYSFLKIVEEGKEYYISWGEPSKQVKEEIELFYIKLTNLVK